MILGISQRCGTNYLYNLLLLHKDIIPSNNSGEDYLLSQSDVLNQYVQKVKSNWLTNWNNDENKLYSGISQGLTYYLNPEKECSFFLTRTPDTRNLKHFPKFFQKTKLIILTRDGKDVAESAAKGFGWFYDLTFKIWGKSAKRIIDFRDENKMEQHRFLIVKYEDLLDNLPATLLEIMRFCNVDEKDYNFEKALNLPVRGSSFLKDDSGSVNWNNKTKNDKPIPGRRSENWGVLRYYRFNYLCGKYSKQLGYPLKHNKKQAVYYPYNFILDVLYPFKIIFIKLRRKYRERFNKDIKNQNIYSVLSLLKENNSKKG